MLRSFATISVFVTLALAQTSPLIPADASAECQAYLAKFDTNADVAACLSAINKATSSFAPGATGTPSSSTISSSLTELCSASVSNVCPPSLFQKQLGEFSIACAKDLSKPSVQGVYDTLYTTSPFLSAACAKDTNDAYCLTNTANLTPRALAASVNEIIERFVTPVSTGSGLERRAATAGFIPNLAAIKEQDIPFFFLTPQSSSAILCTECTRNILTAYIGFESETLPALGIDQSLVLGKQEALVSTVQEQCPSLMGETLNAAGGLGTNNAALSGAISLAPGGALALLFSAVVVAAL